MLSYSRQKKTKKGFTLIELIVVIAILAVLASILVPSMSGILNSSTDTVNLSNARSVFSAAQTLYAKFSMNENPPDPVIDLPSSDDGEFMTTLKSYLGSTGSFSFTVTINETGIESTTYNGQTYTP